MPITDAEILAFQPKRKPYKHYLGKGAYLLVMPNGSKYWRLKYHLNAKEGAYSVGVFPKVSVEAALDAFESARALIRQGINPTDAKREAKAKAIATQTVTQSVFRLGLSRCGAVTIETEANALTLTCLQTQALAAFLTINDGNGREA